MSSPKNTQVACTLDCIYLHPVHSQLGGRCLYNLVIEMVEQLAMEDGINRLELHHKDGKLFYDSTWIAGVDYTDDFYNDIHQDPDY